MQSTKSSANLCRLANRCRTMCLGNQDVLITSSSGFPNKWTQVKQILFLLARSFLRLIPECAAGLSQACKLYFEEKIIIWANKNLFYECSTQSMHWQIPVHSFRVSLLLSQHLCKIKTCFFLVLNNIAISSSDLTTENLSKSHCMIN